MNRRDLIRLLLSAPIAAELDIEKLLWIPEKTIFLPPSRVLSLSQIVAMEIERVVPYMKNLFERDDIFYKYITSSSAEVISDRQMKLPLQIKPGELR